MELNRLGSIYGRLNGSSFAGMVYGTEGLAPTLNTMGGVIDNH